MPTLLEPIGAGITVAMINKFVINNNGWVWKLLSGCWLGCPALAHHEEVEHEQEEEECVPSTSTTTVDSVEVHAHF